MITLDGVPATDLGLIVLNDYEEPSVPSTVDTSLKVPGRHGEYDGGAFIGRRDFSFPCMITKQASTEDLRDKIDKLKRILLDPKGRPRTVRLSMDDEPDAYYNVRYSGALNVRTLLTFANFTLQLTAFDPYKYAEPNAYFSNPGTFSWNSNGKTVTLKNDSHFETPIRFVISGAFANVKITNQATQQWIQINETTAANEVLVIDSGNFTAYKYTLQTDTYFVAQPFPAGFDTKTNVTNLLPKYTGDFFNLVSGENTLVFEGTDVGADVRFEWQHRFL